MPGILSKLFGRKEKEESPVQTEVSADTCPHAVLTPHWDDLADMGKEEKASSFSCSACGTTFSPEEARYLRESEAERLRQGATKTCRHRELIPQWDDAASEGDESQASGFVCAVCNMRFTPAEAQTVRSVK